MASKVEAEKAKLIARSLEKEKTAMAEEMSRLKTELQQTKTDLADQLELFEHAADAASRRIIDELEDKNSVLNHELLNAQEESVRMRDELVELRNSLSEIRGEMGEKEARLREFERRNSQVLLEEMGAAKVRAEKELQDLKDSTSLMKGQYDKIIGQNKKLSDDV